MKSKEEIPPVARATAHQNRPAIVDREGTFTYRDLLDESARVASCLLDGSGDLAESRVAFLVPAGFRHAALLWGVWRAGGVAVPLCVSHPRPELEYVIEDAAAGTLVAHPECEASLRPIARERGLELVSTNRLTAAGPAPSRRLPGVEIERRAMILYTSGTTSRPKGAVWTHRGIRSQIETLVGAWGWRPDDRTLLVLPLHHVHGLINVLGCTLWAGAVCRVLPRFDADEVWRRFLDDDLTVFMAVPTVYAKLIAAWERAAPATRQKMSDACARMRLMVSGSAALSVDLLHRWREISGHTLLERYGMTEIGMALSNPLHGRRRPGFVGSALPGVEIRLVDEHAAAVPDDTPGELEVRGPGLFLEYWGRPSATRAAFRDGWFRTGDVAVVEDGGYRILGRKSVDIIKTGGYKLSALEVEEVLGAHPDVTECAVVGLPDPEWGERVAVVLALRSGSSLTLESLRGWARERIASYKLPTRMHRVDALPRNPLGKVTKPALVTLFES